MQLFAPHTLKHRRALECVLIFVVFPLVLALLKPRGLMYATLWIAAALALRQLTRNGYVFKEDWNGQAIGKKLIKSMFLLFIPLAIALGLFTWIMIPERLFNLPREQPLTWVMVMLFYPLLSVVPQELLFRSFFFRRYAVLFGDGKWLVAASAVVFGWVHILLLNPVAVIFSALGGVIFANTYRQSRSLAAACLEHALYGCLVFSLGLGYYFYHGQAVR